MKHLIALPLLALCACGQADPETTIASEASAGPTESSTPTIYSDTGKQAAWIEQGKDAVRAKLRDPDSAEFRNVKFYSGGGVPLSCGEVNANNGFGGKSGYERFISGGSTITVLESEMASTADMNEAWDRVCRS